MLGFSVPRDNFPVLIGAFAGLFFIQYFWYRTDHFSDEQSLYIFSLLPRLILLFAIPLLSDDYFRFVWDGRLILDGISPFGFLPGDVVQDEAMKTIFNGLNSKAYFSVYPPVMQACFALTSFFAGDNLYLNVVLLKVLILIADLGIVHYAIKILKMLGKHIKPVMLFAFNPLVIVEGVGNLHFETMMMCFAVMAIYYLMAWEKSQRKSVFVKAAIFFALGIMTKIISLLLLPVLIRRIGWGKAILFGVIAGAACVATILPFLSEQVMYNFSTSLDLYFRKFEFNASIYFIANYIYEQVVGWQEIRFVGPLLGAVLIVSILFLSLIRKVADWERYFMMCLDVLTIHLLLSTTVHPWYVINLVVIAIFVRQKYIWVWSFMILFSYIFYPDLVMPNWVLFLEYGALLLMMLWDWGVFPKDELAKT